MEKKKHAGGRPTKYRPEYCGDIIRFFSVDPIIYKDITITRKDGSSIDKTEMEAAPTPYFTAWCAKVGIEKPTMLEWVKKHPEFSTAYKKAKELQREFLMETALKGVHAGAFTIFAFKNMHRWQDRDDEAWRDQQDVNHSGEIAHTHFWAEALKRAREVRAKRDASQG